MLKDTPTPLHGNDRFEGFGIDLINELSIMEGFNYTFIIREDKSNGARDQLTGKWSGMIGDLMEYVSVTDLYEIFGDSDIFCCSGPIWRLRI